MLDLQREHDTAWVVEMVRIAKPGAPVIVESVSLPLCQAPWDWGGVSRDFWKGQVHAWPQVDPDSLEFGVDNMYPGRYHVYFRKRGMLGRES